MQISKHKAFSPENWKEFLLYGENMWVRENNKEKVEVKLLINVSSISKMEKDACTDTKQTSRNKFSSEN